MILAGVGGGPAATGGAFDQTLVEMEIAVIADGDDAAGALAVLLGVDGETVGHLFDLAMAFLELRGFGHQLVGPLVLGRVLEFGETLLDALDLPGDFGRKLGRLRTHARVLRREAVLGIQHRLGPGPAGAQFGGLRFQLP